MRIISGYLGGRNFESPKNRRTHPMSDKMRGGLFNTLGDIKGLSVLDAYSGSGALAIEAISRFAKKAVAIEIDKQSSETIKLNIKNLELENKIKFIRANISSYLNNNKHQLFDIILVDPPYDDIRTLVLNKLSNHLSDNGIFVLSQPGKEENIKISNLEIIKNKVYGDSQLVFYKKIR